MPNVFSKLPFLMSDEDEIDTRYEKCQMYLLRHKDDIHNENVYVGHTINKQARLSKHETRCCEKSYYATDLKLYKYIREHGGWFNWEMVILEDYPCKNKIEATVRENWYFNEYNTTLNSHEPGSMIILGEKQYHQQYRDNHKDKTLKYNKMYNEQNRELINTNSSKYYHLNKEKIKERRKGTILCDCGLEYVKVRKHRHEKTIKHIERMKSINV